MRLDPTHPWNRDLVRDCTARARAEGYAGEPVTAPPRGKNPYWELGSHPEVVERVWDVLGARLRDDCRALIYGTPGLVDPGSGAVLAIAYGTSYVIRVPNRRIEAAVEAGCKTEMSWSTGESTNIEGAFGRGWMFGCWNAQEVDWIAEALRDAQQAER
jgi:hypothetical protein